MSANARPKTLHDLHKWNADLLIVCRSCGRAGVFQLVPILTHFHSKGWNTDWGCVANRYPHQFHMVDALRLMIRSAYSAPMSEIDPIFIVPATIAAQAALVRAYAALVIARKAR